MIALIRTVKDDLVRVDALDCECSGGLFIRLNSFIGCLIVPELYLSSLVLRANSITVNLDT